MRSARRERVVGEERFLDQRLGMHRTADTPFVLCQQYHFIRVQRPVDAARPGTVTTPPLDRKLYQLRGGTACGCWLCLPFARVAGLGNGARRRGLAIARGLALNFTTMHNSMFP